MDKIISTMVVVALLLAAVHAQNAEMHNKMDHGAMTMKSAAVADSCVSNPAQTNCTDYVYPVASAAADLVNLCKAMPFMTACSVAKACNDSGAEPTTPTSPGAANISKADPNICQPFQLVATVCRPKENMMTMRGCASYNTLCANGTKVKQCTDMPGVNTLPTTKDLNDKVRSACEAMNHGDCDLCLPSWQKNGTWGNCDLLDVLGTVCEEMPEMEECTEFQDICRKDRSLWICNKYPKAIIEATTSANDTTSGTVNNAAPTSSSPTATKGSNAAGAVATGSITLVVLLLSAVFLLTRL